ncbi:MAG: hypothetical protein E6R04_01115 [Spirochaetes bacterium]|nr:MAG: hypothetical protein E6R04_01115 [Spirochaetota bacterium]
MKTDLECQAEGFTELPGRCLLTMLAWDKFSDVIREARIAGLLLVVRTMAHSLRSASLEARTGPVETIRGTYEWLQAQDHELFLGDGREVASTLDEFMKP